MMKVYNLDEASKRINNETFNVFDITPRILCNWGWIYNQEANGPIIAVHVAFSGNASHSSKGDITIPYGHYFEVMPSTLFGFEEALSINISQLWDGADVLFIDPPKVATMSDLRVFVDDVVGFINAYKLLLENSRQKQLLIQGLRDWLDNQVKSAANLQAVNTPTVISNVRVSVTAQQNNAITKWLGDHQYDSHKLPKPLSGKSGVKKECRDAVCGDMKLFSSKSVFDTAWDRLRADGVIRDAK